MPYDPRPISEGGNRGANDQFSLCAPKSKFRVVGVDTFDGGDWVQGDFDTLEKAKECADKEGAPMTKTYVYNDKGQLVYEAGTF